MAANAFNLKITSITLSAINFSIPNRTSTTDLTKSDVVIKKYNSGTNTFDSFSAFTLTNITSNSTSGSTATIEPTSDFSNTDLLLIEIVDDSNKSDLTFVDFKDAYTNGIGEFDLPIPSDAGEYKLQILGNDDNQFSSPTTSATAFTSIPVLDATKCSIELVTSKPYLAQYAGKMCKAKITLKDSDGNVVAGNQEITFRANKQ